MDTPSKSDFSVSADQITGSRPVQEDRFLVSTLTGTQEHTSSGYIALSDGVGGEEDGELASQAAVTAAMEALKSKPKNLYEVARAANKHVLEEKQRGNMHARACATLIGVTYEGNKISWVSVGDSLLILRDAQGRLSYLNTRHIQGEFLDAQLAKQAISLAEYESVSAGERKAIYSCISGDPLEYIDEGEHVLAPGERVLIASDGILSLGWNKLTALLEHFQSSTPQATVRAILGNINHMKHPKQDNATLVILDYAHSAATQNSTTSFTRAESGTQAGEAREIAAASLTGDCPRQDDSMCHFSNPSATLAVVSDGAGGHRGANLASKTAVRCAKELWESTLHKGLPAGEAAILLRKLLYNANEAVKKEAVEPGAADNGRAAIVVLYIADGGACVAHVGDCRAYVDNGNGAWVRLTEDDSILQLALRSGLVKPEDAWQHPDQGKLTQALGIDTELTPHVKTFPVAPEDKFLLCCDGFWNQLRPSYWKPDFLNEGKFPAIPAQWAQLAVEAALGKSDNVTLIIINAQAGSTSTRPTAHMLARWLLVFFALLLMVGLFLMFHGTSRDSKVDPNLARRTAKESTTQKGAVPPVVQPTPEKSAPPAVDPTQEDPTRNGTESTAAQAGANIRPGSAQQQTGQGGQTNSISEEGGNPEIQTDKGGDPELQTDKGGDTHTQTDNAGGTDPEAGKGRGSTFSPEITENVRGANDK